MPALTANACVEEVIALHDALEAWLRGRPEAAPTNRLASIAEAFAPEFTLVTPDGLIESKETLVGRLQRAHGSAPELTIKTDDFRLVHVSGEVALFAYTETRTFPGRSNTRRSSALLAASAAAPRSLAWLYLQETWVRVAEAEYRR